MSATMEAPATEDLRVYRLQSGSFEDTEPGWEYPLDPVTQKPTNKDPLTGQPIVPKTKQYRWNGNNIIKTRKDLSHLGPKVMLLSGDPNLIDAKTSAANMELVRTTEAQTKRIAELEAMLAGTKVPEKISLAPTFDTMKRDELVAYLDENEVEYDAKATKADLVAAAKLHAESSK